MRDQNIGPIISRNITKVDDFHYFELNFNIAAEPVVAQLGQVVRVNFVEKKKRKKKDVEL